MGETQAALVPTSYPLHFVYRDLVPGPGFLASIEAKGRVVLYQDPEDEGFWWLHGVNPGGLVAHGASPTEATANLRAEYRATVYEIAEESESFESFRSQLEVFFGAVSAYYRQEWNEALRVVREKAIVIEGLKKSVAPEPSIHIIELKIPDTIQAQVVSIPAFAPNNTELARMKAAA